MSNYVEKILNSIQDLLVLGNPLDPTSLDHQQLSSDDKLFLYETVSLLIVSSNLEAKVKAQLMKSLLTPIINSFLLLINKYCETQPSNEKLKLLYATSLNVSMSVTTRVSKGFSNVVKVKDCECTDIFLEIMRIFMQAIGITTHKSLIHAGIRQYIHRMIICIDSEMLEYLPVIIEHFLRIANEPRDLTDLLPLVNQVVSKYKQQIVPFMQSVIMQLVNGILNYVSALPAEIAADILRITTDQIQSFNLVCTNPLIANGIASKSKEQAMNQNSNHAGTENGNDELLSPDTQFVLDIQLLYKTYFQFVQNIVNNDLMEMFFGLAANDLYKIYFSLIQGAQLGPHDTSKCCFQCIRKFISTFGS
jgi:exportin-T